jgi:hypothetical protein
MDEAALHEKNGCELLTGKDKSSGKGVEEEEEEELLYY